MKPQEFCYWLQGYFEVQNPEALTKEQTQMVKDHLKLVFTKVTPDPKEMKEMAPHLKKALSRALRSIRREREDRDHGVVHVSDPWNRTYC